MAYSEDLAQRVCQALGERQDVEEKRMFGGIGFIVRGNMACGVHADMLIVRVGPEAYQAALAKPHVELFDITGRPMKGWVMVGPAGYESEADLRGWVSQGVAFALSLPPK